MGLGLEVDPDDDWATSIQSNQLVSEEFHKTQMVGQDEGSVPS